MQRLRITCPALLTDDVVVTTAPAADNVAQGIAFAACGKVTGSAIQLALKISGMILAGWATLALQHPVRVHPRMTAERPGTDSICSPDKWSLIVALITCRGRAVPNQREGGRTVRGCSSP